MHILSIRPEPRSGFSSIIARLDIQLTDDVRLFDLRLHEKADGRRVVHGPKTNGSRLMTFSHSFSDEITRAASAALKGVKANDSNAAS